MGLTSPLYGLLFRCTNYEQVTLVAVLPTCDITNHSHVRLSLITTYTYACWACGWPPRLPPLGRVALSGPQSWWCTDRCHPPRSWWARSPRCRGTWYLCKDNIKMYQSFRTRKCKPHFCRSNGRLCSTRCVHLNLPHTPCRLWATSVKNSVRLLVVFVVWDLVKLRTCCCCFCAFVDCFCWCICSFWYVCVVQFCVGLPILPAYMFYFTFCLTVCPCILVFLAAMLGAGTFKCI